MRRDFENEPKVDSVDDPMALAGPDMFPYKPRDMSDVAAELEAALSIEQLSCAIACSPQETAELIRKGRLFSVPHKGSDVYPKWQLNSEGHPISELDGILAALRTASNDPINQLIYMLTGLDFFNGQSIKTFLLAGDYSSAIQEANMIAKL